MLQHRSGIGLDEEKQKENWYRGKSGKGSGERDYDQNYKKFSNTYYRILNHYRKINPHSLCIAGETIDDLSRGVFIEK
jgi:hypothetical protein